MARSTEHSYFPALDDCLTGDTILISWKAAARAISEDVLPDETSLLARFLTSEEALRVLSDVPKPLAAPPSSASKSAFETKTAPIHVSQPIDGEFSLEDIKSDAVWLSKEAQIEELTALRIAIIEWQERPTRLLLDGDGVGAEDTRTKALLTGSVLGRSIAEHAQLPPHATDTTLVDFAKEPKRRDRLVCILLQEISAIFQIHADLITSRAVRNRSSEVPSLTNGDEAWKASLADDVAERQYNNDGRACQHYCRTQSVQFLRDLYTEDRKAAAPQIFTASPARSQVYNATQAEKVANTLRVLLACTTSISQPLHADLVLSWFSLMDDFVFLQDEQQLTLGIQLSSINCLVAMVSLAALQLHQTISRLAKIARASANGDPEYPDLPGDGVTYFMDESCLGRINLVLHRAATFEISVAAPAVYAWSIITAHLQALGSSASGYQEGHAGDVSPLTRRDPSGRRESLQYRSDWERLYDALMDPQLADARTDLPRFFADSAISRLNVYPLFGSLVERLTETWASESSCGTDVIARSILMSLLRAGMTWVAYGEEVLEALFAVLGEDSTGLSRSHHSRSLARRFLDDYEVFRPMILDQALLRYPYELSPLLRLLTLLASAPLERLDAPTEIVEMLEETNIFTVMVPVHFRAYRLESEDEGSNDMILTDMLRLFESKHPSLSIGRNPLMELVKSDNSSRAAVTYIAAGTTGNIIREDPPRVLKLNHTHSALAYLGFLISSILPGSEFQAAPLAPAVDRFSATEAVSLINALMAPSTKQSSWHEVAKLVLYHCSSALGEEQDIVSVLSELFEMELLAHVEQTAQEGSLELVTACTRFFTTVACISPERVWSLLSRSSLLGLNNGTSALAAVVAGTEVRLGQYSFLTACGRLYHTLVDDAIAGLVKRRTHSLLKRGHRFDSPLENADAIPDRIIQSVLVAYQRIMLDAFQNLSTWRFVDAREKFGIVESVVPTFTTLLHAAFGLETADDDNEQSHPISSSLRSAAEMLLLSFVPQSGDNSLLQVLCDLFVDGLVVAEESSASFLRQSSKRHTTHLTHFTTVLVRTAKILSPSAASNFSSRFLRQNMVTLAKLCATDSSTKADICELIAELVEATAQDDKEATSILAPMSQAAARSFLQVLTQMDRPFTNLDAEVKIWHLLSTVLGGQQQWFAYYLLTGSLPRDRLKDTSSSCKQSDLRGNSLLTYALRQLSAISDLPPARAKAMLKFIKIAQIVWIRANSQVRSNSEFITNAISWLNDLHPPGRAANMAQTLLSADEYELAALLCDILAVNLQASMEVGDLTLLKQLRDRLAFLGQHAVDGSLFNRSLHANLTENLSARYQGCSLSSFKRSAANPSNIGQDRVFDLKLANKILSHDTAWKNNTASGRGRGQGFIDEFKRANANLSLVDAQAKLLKSWRALSTSLCVGLESEPSLQLALTQAAEICLNAGSNVELDEPGSAEALESRAELGFMLLSALVKARCTDPAMKKLLLPAWDLVRRSPADFEVATNDNDLAYYRTLLRVLYLAIQPHVYMQPKIDNRPTDLTELELLSPEIGLCLVDIVRRAIAPGFRALCGNLHDNMRLAVPADFALLNGLLQAIISVNGISAVHVQLADVIANTSMVRGGLSLFSWSDRLAESTKQDPIYGEVAINILTTLSAIRPVADEMAVNGALIQLSSANLADYFRKPGGKSPFSEPARMFSIWTDGFLPICLNLLDAVGPPITAQVATFLNSFPEQLTRAESALQQQIPRSRYKSQQGDITLGLVSEAHSLVMISLVLEADEARAAAEGLNATDIPRLALDIKSIRELVESLARNQRSLADRVVPITEREAAWAKVTLPDTTNSLLVERVLVELRDTVACFGDRPGS